MEPNPIVKEMLKKKTKNKGDLFKPFMSLSSTL